MTTAAGLTFTDEYLTAMLPVLAAVCADFDAALMEFNGEADHVHLPVEYPPTIQLSRLVNSLIGASSRLLRQAVPAAHPP
jgi:putative transposase